MAARRVCWVRFTMMLYLCEARSMQSGFFILFTVCLLHLKQCLAHISMYLMQVCCRKEGRSGGFTERGRARTWPFTEDP